MAINLVTYAAQTVTPQDDALIYESALIGSGMIYGGLVTIKSANVLHVAAGHGALCGRKFTIEETDIPISLTASGSLLGRVYIHMDLADTDEPISFQVETDSALTPVIQDSDVNINNGVYEINLATFEVDTSSVSNLVDTRPFIIDSDKAYTTEDDTEAAIDNSDYVPFFDSSANKPKKVLASDLKGDDVTIGYTGTASSSAVRYQRVGINGTYTEINGTKYMGQTKTVSTSGDTTYTFNHSSITTSSVIDVYADVFGINPSNVAVSNGSCVVTIPKQSSAFSLGIRIYIK